MTRLFEAQYGGRCNANGCRIQAGEQIGYAVGYDKPLCKYCWEEEQDPLGVEPD